ncbi:hypothetical protein RUM43_008250 [Polyplax serrata]|uniref:Uncharacterized protein n=1 Tax=Polyplax serrata TaxID=468196 RepID=A0AAN8Q6X9_POLSC
MQRDNRSDTTCSEEYTKITTPRQDVLFKKGYFGRKRESSTEETTRHSGEVEGEEPVMDQIIITNGFVDERGHYLVNGNSYEIYDPYSNTVTVVVGPPPYTNGVTQPVLAAVSCQPVPLQPVDWYPPGSDWPTQGSAWTPSYPRSPQAESLNSPDQTGEHMTNFHGPDNQMPNLYQQPAYVVPGYMFNESLVYNGELVQRNNQNDTTEALCSNDSKIHISENALVGGNGDAEKTIEEKDKATDDVKSEMPCENPVESNSTVSLVADEKRVSSPGSGSPEIELKKLNDQYQAGVEAAETVISRQSTTDVQVNKPMVEKQSHSTQTSLAETDQQLIYPRPEIPFKESHSTQTAPEQLIGSSNTETGDRLEGNNHQKTDPTSDLGKPETQSRTSWKTHNQNRQREYQSSSPRKYHEESPRKIYQKRTSFNDEKKVNSEIADKSEVKQELSPLKMSYAKKAMAGLENINDKNSNKVVNGVLPNCNNKIPNGLKNAQTHNLVVNGANQANGINRTNYQKSVAPDGRFNSYEEKKDYKGTSKNGFVKPRYGKNTYASKTPLTVCSGNERNLQKDFRPKDRKIHLKSFEDAQDSKDKEEMANESASASEKSSTVSELSSPTELSSGQNTPPEKLIVRKMEQKIANEINKSFEEKLKQNLTKKNEVQMTKGEEPAETSQGDVVTQEKGKIKIEGKKKNKGKQDSDKSKEAPKQNGCSNSSHKKKKKKAEESKNKTEADTNKVEDGVLLPNFIIQEPQDLIFRSWEGMKHEEADLISKMDTILTEEEDILKTLGIKEDKMNLSKLPLHSDLLMMLPAFGWNRPKFKIQDIFAPTKQLQNDLFTRRNITSMKSTKPEEFFASVIDGPVTEKYEKRKDVNSKSGKQGKTLEATAGSEKTQSKSGNGTGKKTQSNSVKGSSKTNNSSKALTKTKSTKEEVKEVKVEPETKDKKLGIVAAVSTWLQEQENTENVLSIDSLQARGSESDVTTNEDDLYEEDSSNQKNVRGNPMHASSGSGNSNGRQQNISEIDFLLGNECIRVANVINDSFIHINRDILPRREVGGNGHIRKTRSSSLDGKLSETKIKRHLKFLTDSASFCQDLISDVRNGLPAKCGEYATEELCDPKQSVLKYYTLFPGRVSGEERPTATVRKAGRTESDSENEAFDALEYKFLGRDSIVREGADEESRSSGEVAKSTDRTGNASVTDSGIHSDMDSSEDTSNEQQRDVTCKLQ